MYNKQKAEREKQEELLRKIKMFSQNPELLKDDPQMLEYLNKNMTAKQKDKKQEDKAKRLGLDDGKLTTPKFDRTFSPLRQQNHRTRAKIT